MDPALKDKFIINIAFYSRQRKTPRSEDLGVFPWLKRKNLFQTFYDMSMEVCNGRN
jgi:hypothetical protein